MRLSKSTILTLIIILILVGFIISRFGSSFDIPEGETQIFEEEAVEEEKEENAEPNNSMSEQKESKNEGTVARAQKSSRQIFITDGVKHSIDLDEILSGGPPKDGIPSIDDPKFISTSEADDFLPDSAIGLGLNYQGQTRFYPYQILVWHELVNDVVANDPLLISYCPLCATGVVFDRRVGQEVYEFGVSGRLWRSNLLMYNRTGNEETESLWSQVLGEAVLGEATGDRLTIVSADTVQYGDWKSKHPDTQVLSKDTGAIRAYGVDPYGDYYTNESVSFGASFNDERLHPKAFVLGLELNHQFKAYNLEDLALGTNNDTFAGEDIIITKDSSDAVRMQLSTGQELPYIGGFWFSWLAAHPETELFTK